MTLRPCCLLLLALACAGESASTPASDVVAPGGDTSATDVPNSPDAPVSEDTTVDPDVAPEGPEVSDDVAAAPLPDYLAPNVDGTGPYRVGFRVLEATYTPTVGAHEFAPRTLRVAVWYPATKPNGNPATYTLGITRSTVYSEAVPRGDAPMPVMVFSHGNLGFAESAFFLTEHFASHGWLVLAPDHTGNTYADSGDAVTATTFLTRPLDVSATLDLVYALPDGDPLKGRASQDVIVAGHSFGGYTSIAIGGATYAMDALEAECDGGGTSNFCKELDAAHREAFRTGLRDARFKAILPMAPGASFAFGAAGPGDVAVPVLLSTGGRDNQNSDLDDGDPYWLALPDRNGVARLRLPDAGHMTFSSSCEAIGSIAEGDGCEGAPFIDPLEAHRIITTFSTAFVRAHLFADPPGIAVLNGTPPVSSAEDATLEQR